MKTDSKELRHKILQKIFDFSKGDCYKRIDFKELVEYFNENISIEWEQLLPSISYLEQKGLLHVKKIESIDGNVMYLYTTITVKGIEFLETGSEMENKDKAPLYTYTYNNSTIIEGNQNQVEINYNNSDINSISELLKQLNSKYPENEQLKLAKDEVEESSSKAVNWKLIGSIIKPFSGVLPSILTKGAMKLLGL